MKLEVQTMYLHPFGGRMQIHGLDVQMHANAWFGPQNACKMHSNTW